jgi:hypothetical protein
VSDYSIKRGPWGKPWITRDGNPLDWPEGEPQPLNGHLYDRPSELSGSLDTKENLKAYNQCKAVCGAIKDKSLAWQFRALVSEFADPWVSAKDEVKSLLALAEKIGGDEEKSGIGSAIHRLTHLKDIGAEIHYPVQQLEAWLDCYEQAVLSRYDVLDDEVFVVCDDLENPGSDGDLRTAGNFDKLLRDKVTGEVLVGDVKSGRQDDRYAMKPTIQVATEARSHRYSQETGVREPIHPDLNLSKGVLIHLPFHGGGHPECLVYPLDLDEGWRLAKLSKDITTARKMRVYKRDVISRVKAPK